MKKSFVFGVFLCFFAAVSAQNDTIELKGVDIRAINKQSAPTEKLETKDLRHIPGAEGIENFLTTQAGVNSSNELGTQYSVRGGSYDENIIYVNDIEIYRPLLVRAGQQEGLSFINPDLVQSVAFSTGGFEARYGDKMSSVLDVAYKKPKAFEGSISASLLGASAYVGSSGKRFTQIHGIRYKTSRYLLGTLDEAGEYNPNFIDYQTYMTFAFSPKWEITFLGNFSQNSYEFIPKDRKTTFGTGMGELYHFNVYFEGREEDLFRTAFGALTLNYKPNQNTTLGIIASAFHTNEDETYDITGQYWLSMAEEKGEESATLGVGTYHEHARNKLKAAVKSIAHNGEWKSGDNALKWGIGFQQETIDDRTREWEMRDSAGYSLPGSTSLTDRIASDRTTAERSRSLNLYRNLTGQQTLETYRVQAFVQDTYKWRWEKGTLTLIGGVRGNFWTYNNETLVSPRVALAYIPNWEEKEYVFRFATGLYYQSPFYKELRYSETDEKGNNEVKLNKNIRAQQTYHFVLGADRYFKIWTRPFKFTAETYYKLAPRLTPYIVDNVRIKYLSKLQSKGYTAGVDFKLFGELVPGTDSWVGFSLMNSKEDVEGDNHGYISRPTEQRYSFSMFFQDYIPRHPEYKLHLKFVWADGLPFGPPNGERYEAVFRTPPYRRVDIGASRQFVFKNVKWLKGIWITLEVFNLLDTKNVNSYYWVSTVDGREYAVPNYLTSRKINLKLAVDF
ncbi:MAG: TonB-dependent receptor plug domain-containing protein [Prevotellaceae bacterium]|nr:TonB-dependent receptor plug domain-containing protein [Prevotellaceae bacterium]